MLIDAQVHVVSPDRYRYPIDPPSPDRLPWWDRYARSVEELVSDQEALGIDRGVLVHAYSAYRYNSNYTADAAARYPGRFAATCGVDLTGDPATDARYWVQERAARAIRLFLQYTEDGWTEGPIADGFLDALGSLGAIAQILAQARQLPGVLALVKRHPDVPVLIDHCAYPDLSGGPGYPNAGNLFSLADAGNIRLKLSTHVFKEAREKGVALGTFTEDLVAAFGADRIMWASDVTIQERSYADCLADAREACAGLSEADRDLVLGGTAAAFWWPGA